MIRLGIRSNQIKSKEASTASEDPVGCGARRFDPQMRLNRKRLWRAAAVSVSLLHWRMQAGGPQGPRVGAPRVLSLSHGPWAFLSFGVHL